jgi:hypothetical protein
VRTFVAVFTLYVAGPVFRGLFFLFFLFASVFHSTTFFDAFNSRSISGAARRGARRCAGYGDKSRAANYAAR